MADTRREFDTRRALSSQHPMQELLADNFEVFAHDYAVKDGTFLRTDATYTAHLRVRKRDAQ